jgi:hypothetical protein
MTNTPVRTVRLPDGLWEATLARSVAEGTTVSAIMREALENYIAQGRTSDESHIERRSVIQPGDPGVRP